MDTMPVITYFWDGFQKPSPFKADIAVDIESVFNNKIRQLAAHESQFFEWLPHVDGCHESVPNDPAHRLDWLKAYQWLHSPQSQIVVERAWSIDMVKRGPQSSRQKHLSSVSMVASPVPANLRPYSHEPFP